MPDREAMETYKKFRKLAERRDGGICKEKAKPLTFVPNGNEIYGKEFDRIFGKGKK